MTSRLFLDFDGTLSNPHQRLYQLFCELAPESTFSYEEYWRHKRDNVSQRQLLVQYLQYTDVQVTEFKSSWMEKVEEPKRLALDVPLDGVQEFLAKSSQKFELLLVTGRQHLDRLITQMQSMGLYDNFSDVLNTAQKQSKAALIRSRTTWGVNDILVGDTGEDILAGKELGMRTVAVTSGALSEENLRKYQPDFLLESVIHMERLVVT